MCRSPAVRCPARSDSTTARRLRSDPCEAAYCNQTLRGARPVSFQCLRAGGARQATFCRLDELPQLGRTLLRRVVDVLAYFDRPPPPTVLPRP
jgi:hypothetical protein